MPLVQTHSFLHGQEHHSLQVQPQRQLGLEEFPPHLLLRAVRLGEHLQLLIYAAQEPEERLRRAWRRISNRVGSRASLGSLLIMLPLAVPSPDFDARKDDNTKAPIPATNYCPWPQLDSSHWFLHNLFIRGQMTNPSKISGNRLNLFLKSQ